MQQPSSIPGPPSLLIVQGNASTAQPELGLRLADALRRQGVPVQLLSLGLHGEAEKLAGVNCLVLLAGHAAIAGEVKEALGDRPRLVALYPRSSGLQRHDILVPDGPAAMAVVAKPEMTEREAALFFVELFSELHTHCKAGISAAMLRFCFAKASRLAPNKAEIWV